MQFQVPQFTETETKVIGPFTIRQFLWIAIGGVLVFIFSFIITSTALIIFTIIIAAISLSFAFIKIQEVSLARYIGYAILYLLGIHRYTFDTTTKTNDYLPPEQHNVNY